MGWGGCKSAGLGPRGWTNSTFQTGVLGVRNTPLFAVSGQMKHPKQALFTENRHFEALTRPKPLPGSTKPVPQLAKSALPGGLPASSQPDPASQPDLPDSRIPGSASRIPGIPGSQDPSQSADHNPSKSQNLPDSRKVLHFSDSWTFPALPAHRSPELLLHTNLPVPHKTAGSANPAHEVAPQ